MSTLKCNAFRNTATNNGGIDIDATGHVQIDGVQLPTAGTLSNRNRVINGDMRIAQRGTSAFTGTDKFPADRWVVGGSTSVALTSQNESTEVPTGFQNSAKLSITTADSSIAAGDAWDFTQHIEGYNVADLLFGTSSAKSVTLSFSVNCTSTGTFCVVLLGSSDGSTLDRSYVAEYTINTADTWEQKTITVPGDTGGTWHTGNGKGLSVRFGLTAGTTYQKAAGSWGAGNVIGSSNQTQLLSTANSEWYVTGVQLEVGEKATPFEHRSFGDELARCERYCQVFEYTGQYHLICQGIIETGKTIENIFYLRRPMRTFPSCTLSNIANFRLNDFRGNDEDADAFIGISRGSLSTANLKFRKPTSNMDPGRAGYVNAATSSGATMTFSAEL